MMTSHDFCDASITQMENIQSKLYNPTAKKWWREGSVINLQLMFTSCEFVDACPVPQMEMDYVNCRIQELTIYSSVRNN